MKLFDAASTAQALPFPALIAALERMFLTGCEVPARHVHAVGEALTTLLMPAWQPGRYVGLKVVQVAPGNAALGLPAVSAVYQLFDANTGVALALIDGGAPRRRRRSRRRGSLARTRAACWSSAPAASAACWRRLIAQCARSMT